MKATASRILAIAFCSASVALLVACAEKPLPPLSVEELIADPVMLDGVLMKCNAAATSQRPSIECKNARVAVDRIARQREQEEIAKSEAAFERNRERLRQQQDTLRRQQEEAKKVDPYKLPLIPPADPAAQPPATANN